MELTRQQLVTGEIALPLLKVILENREQFLEINKIANLGEASQPPIELVVETRELELKRYKELQIELSSFLFYGTQFKSGEQLWNND